MHAEPRRKAAVYKAAQSFFVIFILLLMSGLSRAAESCITIHGRAHFYVGDGQLRIWQIGTHHEFEPQDPASRGRVIGWLEEGVKSSEGKNYAAPASMVYLFADFEVCPTEPFKQGAVQSAKVLSASHRRYVPAE
jgi:hypothetical protein